MSYLTITYTIKPGTKKNTYLMNPKGFSIKNDFARKSLTGVYSNGEQMSKMVSEFKRMNPSFPIASFYISDANGNILVKPIVSTQPIKQNLGVIQNTATNDSDKTARTYFQTKPKEEEERPSIFSSPIVLIGLAGLAYYLFKGKK